MTSVFTRTTMVTTTQYSFYPVSTSTVTWTATNYMQRSYSFWVLPATSELCYWHHLQHTHLKGQRILGSVSSNVDIRFFVMNQVQFDAHKSREVRTCRAYRPMVLVSAIDVSSYNFDVLIPEDGDYHYVFWNPNEELAFGTFELWTEGVQTKISVVSGTKTLTSEYATTQTLSSVFSTKTGEVFSIRAYGGILIIAVGVILVAIGGVFVYKRRVAFKKR